MMDRVRKTVTQLTAAVSVLAMTATPTLAQGLIRDTEIERVMAEYTEPLLVAAELDPNSVDFYLVGDMEFNAFVTQGQNIFLNTGTIVRAHNVNEIKGVIAHEIGHIQGAHLARSGEEARGSMVTMAATMAVGIIAAAAGAGQAGAAIMASSSQFAQLDFLRYSRGQEASADQAAVRFLTTTGQSGRGLVTTFERLAYQERLSEARRWAYFRSHPLSSERVAALRRNVEASPYVDIPDSEDDMQTLRRLQAKIIGFMVPPAQTFDRFPPSDLSIPARYARAVAYYKQGLTDRAAEEVDGLIELEPDNPFFYELKGQMLYENGRIDASIAPYERSVELLPDAPLFRIGLAGSLIATGETDRMEEAVRQLNFALVEENENPYGWRLLASAHAELGNEPMAEYATAEQFYHGGNPMQAYIFASRAFEDLERGSHGWIRAAEIMAVAGPQAQRMQGRNGQGRRQPVMNFQHLP